MTYQPRPLSPIFNFAYGIFKSHQTRIEAELVQKYGEIDWRTPQSEINYFMLRFEEAMGLSRSYTMSLFDWIFSSREHTNYTLPVKPVCIEYMASFVANIAQIPFAQARGYIRELQEDTTIPQIVNQFVNAHPENVTIDSKVRYGKRLAWYALARAKKPKVIIETGIDKGLGSLVLTLAVINNKKEGVHGQYYGLDISPHAGFLLQGQFLEVGTILRGDSIETLQKIPYSIDMLLCDSDHTEGYELREYKTAEPKLSQDAVIISDTASYDGVLLEYANATNRKFLYCPEYTDNHWYPGDGIGIAYR
jgi:predicted O-methyltransferase YrrM